MKKQTAIIFYILGIYVVIQFAWWGYHLIELTEELSETQNSIDKRILMITGEGLVFLLILLLGLWKIRSSIKKELKLSKMQNNFLLSITHELKTPVAANKLLLQTLQKRNLSEEKKAELIEKSINETKRLEKLIHNILNAAQLENRKLTLHKESTNIEALIRQNLDRFTKQFPSTHFIFKPTSTVVKKVDPLIIEAVLNNLIENAQKYGGGTVEVELEETNIDQYIIRVSDNGNGIAKEDLPYIFNKFYRSGNENTRTQKGSGLGLFIAYEFSRLHNGNLTYHQNQPKGATFELTL